MYLFIALISILSLVPASIAGSMKYRELRPENKPFIFYIWAGLANELVSLACSYTIHSTVVNNNCFMLIESLLLLWQLTMWQKLRVRKFVLFIPAAIFVLAWGLEMVYKRPGVYIFYYSLLYSGVFVLWASHQLASRVVWHKQPFFRDATLLIYCGLICYFSMRIFVEASWYCGLDKSSFFRNNIFTVLACINALVNLLYAYAILWMQKKPSYTTL